MLDSLDAQELQDWWTYELSEGPLDRSYDREILVQILEHLMVLIKVSAQRAFEEDWPNISRPYISFDKETSEEKAAREAKEKQATVDALNLMIPEA